MAKKFGLTVGHVVLKGFDGNVFANGKLSLKVLADTKLLSRNGHIYTIDLESSGRGISVYREVRPPYVIIEF